MAEVPIEVLLEDRKQTHGSFYEHSRVTQEMKKAFHDAVMRRTWKDIEGYARIAVEYQDD
jgi:hypothetical protein